MINFSTRLQVPMQAQSSKLDPATAAPVAAVLDAPWAVQIPGTDPLRREGLFERQPTYLTKCFELI